MYNYIHIINKKEQKSRGISKAGIQNFYHLNSGLGCRGMKLSGKSAGKQITDLLITDYSSVVFEASLLDIPMLFYAFDLFDYISKRDFYYDFESFVPGKIVFSQRELTEAIVAGDFESEKVPPFKTKFFDHLDGRSSRRVADLILRFIGEEA